MDGATSLTERCFSRDGESFQFRSLGELLDDMAADGALELGAVYHEADCEPLQPRHFDCCAESLLDNLDDVLADEVGEVADCDFSSVDSEAKDELVALLRGWIAKHVNTKCYWVIVGKTRERTVTADDVAEYAS